MTAPAHDTPPAAHGGSRRSVLPSHLLLPVCSGLTPSPARRLRSGRMCTSLLTRDAERLFTRVWAFVCRQQRNDHPAPSLTSELGDPSVFTHSGYWVLSRCDLQMLPPISVGVFTFLCPKGTNISNSRW